MSEVIFTVILLHVVVTVDCSFCCFSVYFTCYWLVIYSTAKLLLQGELARQGDYLHKEYVSRGYMLTVFVCVVTVDIVSFSKDKSLYIFEVFPF